MANLAHGLRLQLLLTERMHYSGKRAVLSTAYSPIPLTVDKVFTIPEIAAYMKISKSKINDLVYRKEIPHLRVGRNVRIRESDFLRSVELQIEKASL